MIIVNVNIGDKYGMLEILEELPISISPCGLKYRKFKCKCDCGSIKDIRLGDLRKKGSKRTLSCGCYVKNNNKLINTTHGMSYGRLYRIFRGILNRCNRLKDENYFRYGGRGIKCQWNSFEEFYNDMYESYLKHCKEFGEKQTSIDRIDNNGNYSKQNCKWSTMKEQGRNRRNTKLYLGKTIAQWCEELNLNRAIIDGRIKRKWGIKKALGII